MNRMNMKGGALLCTLLAITMGTTALADPPGEDILYPEGGERSGTAGKMYLQFDVGANQSELYGAGGIHGGVGEPGIIPGYLKSANGTAPYVAATIGYQVTPAFSLALRFDYDMRFASNSGDAISTCVDYDELGEPSGTHPITLHDRYEVSASYAGVALLPTVHFGDFFLFAGPSYSVPLSKDIRQTVSIGEDEGNCTFFYGTDEASTSVSGRISGSDFMKERLALKLGLGYTAEISSGTKLVLQAGYDLGTDELFEEQELIMLHNTESNGTYQEPIAVGDDLRFNSFQGSIGIRVNL